MTAARAFAIASPRSSPQLLIARGGAELGAAKGPALGSPAPASRSPRRRFAVPDDPPGFPGRPGRRIGHRTTAPLGHLAEMILDQPPLGSEMAGDDREDAHRLPRQYRAGGRCGAGRRPRHRSKRPGRSARQTRHIIDARMLVKETHDGSGHRWPPVRRCADHGVAGCPYRGRPLPLPRLPQASRRPVPRRPRSSPRRP